jgi:hypothetical protein
MHAYIHVYMNTSTRIRITYLEHSQSCHPTNTHTYIHICITYTQTYITLSTANHVMTLMSCRIEEVQTVGYATKITYIHRNTHTHTNTHTHMCIRITYLEHSQPPIPYGSTYSRFS